MRFDVGVSSYFPLKDASFWVRDEYDAGSLKVECHSKTVD